MTNKGESTNLDQPLLTGNVYAFLMPEAPDITLVHDIARVATMDGKKIVVISSADPADPTLAEHFERQNLNVEKCVFNEIPRKSGGASRPISSIVTLDFEASAGFSDAVAQFYQVPVKPTHRGADTRQRMELVSIKSENREEAAARIALTFEADRFVMIAEGVPDVRRLDCHQASTRLQDMVNRQAMAAQFFESYAGNGEDRRAVFLPDHPYAFTVCAALPYELISPSAYAARRLSGNYNPLYSMPVGRSDFLL